MVNKNNFLKYSEIPHTADRRILVYGRSIEELFINAGEGLYWIAGISPKKNINNKEKQLVLEAFDNEALLVKYLEELLYFVQKKLVAVQPVLRIKGQKCQATLPLFQIDSINHEIKAVTFYDLEIYKSSGLYKTKITFDL